MSESHNSLVTVLASGDRESGGGGSTMETFIIGTQTGEVAAEVGLVICNNSPGTVGVYDRVERLNKEYGLEIEVATINGSTHPKGKQERGQTLEEAAAICELLGLRGISKVLCLGYMKKLNGELVEEYGWKPEYAQIDPINQGIYLASALNTHPGLLPHTADTYGIHAAKRALGLYHEGVIRETAQTLQVVGAGIDKGPTVESNPVPIFGEDDPQRLFERTQDVEKNFIVSDIQAYLAARAAYHEAA